MAKKAKAPVDDRDPVERASFEKRRGTLAAFDYDSWETMSIFVGDDAKAGGIDAIVKKLSKAKKVGLVEADVTQAALTGKLDQPDAPHLLIVKLKGHDWAPVYTSFAERYDTDTAKEISRDAATKVLWCGHQDTASATAFQLFDGGEQVIEFESCGEEYIDEDDEPEFATRFKSKLHKKNWWRQHDDEDGTLQALVRELNAYVPMFFFGGNKKGKIELEAYPEDTLLPHHVERIVLAVYGPAKSAKPSKSGKDLRQAIEQLNVADVDAALAAGADQNLLPGTTSTALTHAIGAALRDPDKGLPVIDALLRAGADVNDAGNGNPPIWEVFEAPQGLDRKLPVLQRLIAAGADLNAKAAVSYHKGNTPLHFIATVGDLNLAQFLVAHGADPRVKDKKGETPAKSAKETVRSMLEFIDDEDGEHSGPIKSVIEFLERVEKGKIKPSELSKDPTAMIDAEKARNAKLRAEVEAAIAKVGVAIRSLEEVEKEQKRNEQLRAQAAEVATARQPKKIHVKAIKDVDGRWLDLKYRDLSIAALKERGFELIGGFEVREFVHLQMVGLLHPKQHIYAAVCQMVNNRWIDLVQYYSDSTQLNATNAKSAPEAQVEAPKQRKVREPKWGVAKLADWMLKEPPPAGAKVLPLKADDFAKRFEQDYEHEMKHRTAK